MRVSIVSDVHLEFGSGVIENADNADVLILAGDICVAEDLKRHPTDECAVKKMPVRQVSAGVYRRFFQQCVKEFEHVIFIAGNHEHYDGEFDFTHRIIQASLAGVAPSIHFLEKSTVEINSVLFLGATMWTDLNKRDDLTAWHLRQSMNDYRVIRVGNAGYRRLLPGDTLADHASARKFFKNTLEANRTSPTPKPVVCVTHHAPTAVSLDKNYRQDYLMNGGYFSDLSELILDNPEIALWAHGHIHSSSDYIVGTTRVVCNPRGYYGEQHTDHEITLVTVEI